ncbi:MAG: glycosyltransferase [Spirochaetales bacterium]|nr:glycosyltransferase [Spirochaetales bacterium]
MAGRRGKASREIAVLLPCYNEAVTIAGVVADFRKALPGARIYVFDNNSSDDTAERALKAGARVVPSRKQGKGHVVQHMFESVEADIYLMADGDATYPAASAMSLIELVESGADMAVGTRMSRFQSDSFRRFHVFGNHLVSGLISFMFGSPIKDVLSGYRAFSRDFVKSIPLLSAGFEIETELTLQALTKGFVVREIPIEYGERPAGSFSKLSTFSDGFLVLKSIFMIFKDYKPLVFFGLAGALLALASLGAGFWPIMDYIQEKYVYHVPLAILAAGLAILSVLCFAVGLILDTINKYHNETFSLLRKLSRRSSQEKLSP